MTIATIATPLRTSITAMRGLRSGAALAVAGIDMSNDDIRFRGRFSGVAIDVFVPIGAVLGIYARENGQGMVFEPEQAPPPSSDDEPRSGKPSLRVVK